MVAPSRRKEMARGAVAQFKVSIRLACEAFDISESGYHYLQGFEAVAMCALRLQRPNDLAPVSRTAVIV